MLCPSSVQTIGDIPQPTCVWVQVGGHAMVLTGLPLLVVHWSLLGLLGIKPGLLPVLSVISRLLTAVA